MTRAEIMRQIAILQARSLIVVRRAEYNEIYDEIERLQGELAAYAEA